MQQYRYILEPYKGPSSRHKCPECGKPLEFARYIDTETGEQLPDHVGRCNRESACGYHLTPKQYFEQAGGEYKPTFKKAPEIVKPVKIDYVSSELVDKSMQGFMKTNFALWLTSLFGPQIAEATLLKYKVGRSSVDNGKACIFWRIDKEQRVRTGKIVCYNPETGKRRKGEFDPKPFFVHAMKRNEIDPVTKEVKQVNVLPEGNYQQCFFGEALLSQYPEKKVGVVESEKTALIASIFMPDLTWIATGGASGCKWKEYSVFKALQNKTVVLFPDFGYFNKKAEKTCFEEWTERAEAIVERMPCKIKVSSILEDRLTKANEEERPDLDLVDILVKQDKATGLAITDDIEDLPGYPILWDLKTAV